MNHYVLHQNNCIGLSTLEDGNYNLDHNNKGSVICPKPTRPLRWKFCQQSEYSNVGANEELLDLIQNNEYSFSPPSYLLGSPPVRASNPLIQDAQFGCEKEKQQINPAQSIISSLSSSPGLSSPSSPNSAASSPSSPLRKGGCVRMKFGIKSAKVRVVGFDCNIPGVAY